MLIIVASISWLSSGRDDITARTLTLLLVAGIAAWTSADAQQLAYKYDLTPYGAYRFGGSFAADDASYNVDANDSGSLGLIFNIRDTANTQWEFLYSRQDTDATIDGGALSGSTTGMEIQYLQAGGTYHSDRGNVWPFVALTVGGTHIKTSDASASSDTFFSFSLGIGMQIRPTDRFGIRLEARGYGTVIDSNTDLFCQTDPASNVCAIRVSGDVFWQLETLVGLVFRF